MQIAAKRTVVWASAWVMRVQALRHGAGNSNTALDEQRAATLECARLWVRIMNDWIFCYFRGLGLLHRSGAYWAVGALLTLLLPHAALSNEPLRRPHAVEPIVLMQEGALEGCGVRIVYFTPTAKVDFDVVTLREGEGTTFDLSVFWRDRYDRPQAIIDFQLETAKLHSAEQFPAVTRGDGDGMLSTRMALEQLTGAQFIQGLMVSGGTLTIRVADGTEHGFDVPGPMANLIRASYLNCSGDLYRPLPVSR